MEASSPLAALRAPSFMPGWSGSDLYGSHAAQFSSNIFGPGAFNFRDISIKRSSKPDCFKSSLLRGSSPTASLAADLSQNFHIDMSPQLPTPRRSLFTSNLFGTIDIRDSVTSTPIPSHSEKLHESMEISPLPHKQPRSTQMQLQSPTPVHTSMEEILSSSPPLSTYSDISRPISCLEKKSLIARSSISRGRNYSILQAACRKSEILQSSFRFEAGSSKLSTSTSMSLDECFLDSSPQERRPQSAISQTSSSSSFSSITNGPPRLGKAFGSNNSSLRLTGSPLGNGIKRSSNPLIRPRKLFRRSLSMVEQHANSTIESKRDDTVVSNLHTVMDIEELHQPTLPHFFQEGNPDSIPRISQKTLLEVLDGAYSSQFDESMIVDCRFEYEFEGGHIDGAVNYNNKELLSGELFSVDSPRKILLIFHCEYSAHRAPIMARHIRKQDRAANVEQYPKLTYPEVYILDGGYSAFFAHHRERCFPQNYVEMGDKDHTFTCEREMGRLRKNRSKFSRAQTFAFGQSPIDDSPTAPHRCRNVRNTDIDMVGVSSPLSSGRRTVTY